MAGVFEAGFQPESLVGFSRQPPHKQTAMLAHRRLFVSMPIH